MEGETEREMLWLLKDAAALKLPHPKRFCFVLKRQSCHPSVSSLTIWFLVRAEAQTRQAESLSQQSFIPASPTSPTSLPSLAADINEPFPSTQLLLPVMVVRCGENPSGSAVKKSSGTIDNVRHARPVHRVQSPLSPLSSPAVWRSL